jgi:hypothetical protein
MYVLYRIYGTFRGRALSFGPVKPFTLGKHDSLGAIAVPLPESRLKTNSRAVQMRVVPKLARF